MSAPNFFVNKGDRHSKISLATDALRISVDFI